MDLQTRIGECEFKNQTLLTKVNDLTIANLELQSTLNTTRKQCDEMYYDFQELKTQYKTLAQQFNELKRQFEILQGKYDANVSAIGRQRQEFLTKYRPQRASPKKILSRKKKSVSFHETPDILIIESESKGKKVGKMPSLEKFIRESGMPPDAAIKAWFEAKRK